MAVLFFGQYLVEKGIVSREILLEAIALQEKANLSFGDTAVELGLLTTADSNRINQAQRSEDMRIGDLAVKMGLLTDDQVMQILAEQKKRHLYIGEAVVKVGGLTETKLGEALSGFKADQALYATDSIAIPNEFPTPHLWEMMADMTYKMITRVARVTFHSEACQANAKFPHYPVIAAMEMHGDKSLTYILGCTEGFQTKIARAILSTDDVSQEPKEVLDDTIMEFVNVVCGNIVAKAAQSSVALEILPPELLSEVVTHENQQSLLFPIYLADGDSGTLMLLLHS